MASFVRDFHVGDILIDEVWNKLNSLMTSTKSSWRMAGRRNIVAVRGPTRWSQGPIRLGSATNDERACPSQGKQAGTFSAPEPRFPGDRPSSTCALTHTHIYIIYTIYSYRCIYIYNIVIYKIQIGEYRCCKSPRQTLRNPPSCQWEMIGCHNLLVMKSLASRPTWNRFVSDTYSWYWIPLFYHYCQLLLVIANTCLKIIPGNLPLFIPGIVNTYYLNMVLMTN